MRLNCGFLRTPLLRVQKEGSHIFGKKIKIIKCYEPVSCKAIAVNLSHHCSTDPTIHSGLRLVGLIFFFIKKNEKESKY